MKKPKYRYFILCNCFQPIRFDVKTGVGYWFGRKRGFDIKNKLPSIFQMQTLIEGKFYKTLEVNSKEFYKFGRSKYNQVSE